tara:strand:+ start:1103 stop:1261 length:159 start_codon:yes stop_codon:yes gene_type:complete
VPIWERIEKDQLEIKRQHKKEDKEKQLNQEKMRKEAEDKSKEDYKNNIERIK